MVHDDGKILDLLIGYISEMREVQSVGISGSRTPLPKAGEGDIDIFIIVIRYLNLRRGKP